MSDFKDLYPKEELPYDKFLHTGAESLTDAELLAIMLRQERKTRIRWSLADRFCRCVTVSGGFLGCIIIRYVNYRKFLELVR